MEVNDESNGAAPCAVAFDAEDGFTIKGFVWRQSGCGNLNGESGVDPRPIAIVNAATSVRCRYYFRFAAYLFAHGWDVLVYDYRGIGESRPPRLAGFRASWLDWGRLDFEAALRFVQRSFPGQPIDVVAHSIGGFVLGLAPSNAAVRRVFTMGAQYAYWRDYAKRERLAMLLKWHWAMPALAYLFGYVPAARLGWMEDTPRGVALSWSRSRASFEDTYQRPPIALPDDERTKLANGFARLSAPLLAVSVTDDPFGTVPAIERLLGYFSGSEQRIHLRIAPADAQVDKIGHFAFFHRRFEAMLWPIALQWLKTATIAASFADRTVSRREATFAMRSGIPTAAQSAAGEPILCDPGAAAEYSRRTANSSPIGAAERR
jgi:predicted alpha/beta hydrolase